MLFADVSTMDVGIVVLALAALLHMAVNVKHLLDKPSGKESVERESFAELRRRCDEDHDRLARTMCRDDILKILKPLEDSIVNLRVSQEELHRNLTRDLHESIARVVDRVDATLHRTVRFVKGPREGDPDEQ